jgi:uncharacterized protein
MTKRPNSRSTHRAAALPAVATSMLSLLLLAGTAAAQAQNTFEDGRQAYDFGSYAAAMTIWGPLAQSGDARSQSSLAYLYREGKGVVRDSVVAARWYYRAAIQGEPTAQSALCDMNLRGDGVSDDPKTALFWCELSMEGGDTSGIALRERALNRLSTEQRDEVWAMIARWHDLDSRPGCCGVGE